MNKQEEVQAREVIAAMESFLNEINHIEKLLDGKRFINQHEKDNLQSLLKKLKEDIARAAKRGTVSELNASQNHFEKAYFKPALAHASAHFRIKPNSHPINSNWISELVNVEGDIAHFLYQLKSQFPDS